MRHTQTPPHPPPPPPTPATPAVEGSAAGYQQDSQGGRKLQPSSKAKGTPGPDHQISPGSKSQRSRDREVDRVPSWVSLRGLFLGSTSSSAGGSCVPIGGRAHLCTDKSVADKKKKNNNNNNNNRESGGGSSGRLRCSVSICNSKGSSEVMLLQQQQGNPDKLPTPTASATPTKGCYGKAVAAASRSSTSSRCDLIQQQPIISSKKNKTKVPLKEIDGNAPATTPTSASSSFSSSRAVVISSSSSSTASSSSVSGSFRGRPLRRFSVCQECHLVVDPLSRISREPSLTSTLCPCPDCGEVFIKPDSLELHQKTRHAVLELGPEDTSRNIVEIIFQSSWLKKQPASCKIDRILKINNTKSTISRFEDYRDAVRSRARKASHRQQLPKKAAASSPAALYPRCAADGNELLRFHCATVACSVGAKGSTTLCACLPKCAACGIIRDGFRPDAYGKIRTMATSGRAHDTAQGDLPPGGDARTRAMLVCRVIAGRIMRGGMQDAAEEYDSVAGPAGVYSTLDELFVFNTRAILPCFLVIYREP